MPGATHLISLQPVFTTAQRFFVLIPHYLFPCRMCIGGVWSGCLGLGYDEEREPITGVWSRAPSGVQEQSPWLEGQGAKPLEADDSFVIGQVA